MTNFESILHQMCIICYPLLVGEYILIRPTLETIRQKAWRLKALVYAYANYREEENRKKMN